MILKCVFIVIVFLLAMAPLEAMEEMRQIPSDLDLAEKKLQILLAGKLPPEKLGEGHLLLGRVYYEKEDLARAVQEFDFVLKNFQEKDLVDAATYWTAEVYYKDGDYKQAVALYQTLLEGDHPSPVYGPFALYSQGWCYEKMGEIDTAIETFLDAAAKFHRSEIAGKAQYKAAEMLYKAGRYERASSEIKVFIEEYPVNERIFDAYYILGDCFYKTGRYPEAVWNFGKALGAGAAAPWKDSALLKTAESFKTMGDRVRAEEVFRKVDASSADPVARSAALLGLAGLYFESARYDKAGELYGKIVRDVPENRMTSAAYYWLAECFYRKGDLREAVKIYGLALKRFPQGPIADLMLYDLAWSYKELGEDDNSLNAFREIVEKASDKELAADALGGIGDILRERGDFEKAAAAYDRILRDFPDSSLVDYAQYEVGQMLAKMGRNDGAILAFRSLLLNFPDSRMAESARRELCALGGAKNGG